MMIDLSLRCGPSSNCSHAATPTVPSIIAALAKRGVEVGRPFPALPSFLRVTIGTSSEMKSFLNAFRVVMGENNLRGATDDTDETDQMTRIIFQYRVLIQ